MKDKKLNEILEFQLEENKARIVRISQEMRSKMDEVLALEKKLIIEEQNLSRLNIKNALVEKSELKLSEKEIEDIIGISKAFSGFESSEFEVRTDDCSYQGTCAWSACWTCSSNCGGECSKGCSTTCSKSCRWGSKPAWQ